MVASVLPIPPKYEVSASMTGISSVCHAAFSAWWIPCIPHYVQSGQLQKNYITWHIVFDFYMYNA